MTIRGTNGQSAPSGRFSFSKQVLKAHDFDLADYIARVKKIIQVNRHTVQQYVRTENLLRAPFKETPNRLFTIDGSMVLPRLPENENPYTTFFSVPDRVSRTAVQIHSRGTRYLASIDPTFEVSQKLNVLESDFHDSVAALHLLGSVDERNVLFQLSIADYLKNSVVTILNAFISREKIGDFQLSNPEYQNLRRELVFLSLAAVSAYYELFLQNAKEYEKHIACLDAGMECVRDACDYLRTQYRQGIFEVSFFSRPEASNPLINLASILLFSIREGKETGLVVGLPSGATEVALGMHWGIRRFCEAGPNLLLLPISLHSAKNQFGGDSSRFSSGHLEFLAHNRRLFARKKIIAIADDNSSTGRTVQKASDLISSVASRTARITCSVAEADIVRSVVDWDREGRTNIASLNAYRFSVNILPVSRRVRPKVDVRESKERTILERGYAAKPISGRSAVDLIEHELALRLIREPTEGKLKYLVNDNSIRSFRHTQLSNFYITPMPILYKEIEYPSVEHAYQAQKFDLEVLKRIKLEDRQEIEELLRKRGRVWEATEINEAFADRNMSAGNIKVIADHLQRKGLARVMWNDMKVRIMIQLLVQKFGNDVLRRYLLSTGSKYLMEGNDWGDVFWGVEGRRGRNVLGHLLMIIRERSGGKARGLQGDNL